MRPAAVLAASLSALGGWLSFALARASRRPAAPTAPDPESFDDARELVERLADSCHGKIISSRFLKAFCHLLVRDEDRYLYSERDALTRSMASLAGCDPEALRRDVELVAEFRDEDEEGERASLERMADPPAREQPDEPPLPGQYL